MCEKKECGKCGNHFNHLYRRAGKFYCAICCQRIDRENGVAMPGKLEVWHYLCVVRKEQIFFSDLSSTPVNLLETKPQGMIEKVINFVKR